MVVSFRPLLYSFSTLPQVKKRRYCHEQRSNVETPRHQPSLCPRRTKRCRHIVIMTLTDSSSPTGERSLSKLVSSPNNHQIGMPILVVRATIRLKREGKIVIALGHSGRKEGHKVLPMGLCLTTIRRRRVRCGGDKEESVVILLRHKK